MTVLFGPSPITLHAGTTTSPALTVPDAAVQLLATLFHWNGVNSTSCQVELSFDNGATWRPVRSITSASPNLDTKNPDGRMQCWAPARRLCVCGELYDPGNPLNGTTVNHSTYFGWTSQQIAAIFPGQWLHEADPAAFHNPDLTPATGLPLRQVHVVCNATGNINSQLLVEWF